MKNSATIYSFEYNVENVNKNINGKKELIASQHVEGYISDANFLSETEMEHFLEVYYGPEVIFTEVDDPASVLTEEEVSSLYEKKGDRISLFEWGRDVYPDGQEVTWQSGRQPKKWDYLPCKQVNISTSVDGVETPWMGDYDPDGYQGVLTDTVYLDGASSTDWKVFVGSEAACMKFIQEMS